MSALFWILVAAVVVGAVPYARCIKELRRRDNTFFGEWRALEPERKAAIRQALRSGLAVHDEADARLALAAAAQGDRVRGAMRPLNAIVSLMLLAELLYGVVSGTHWVVVLFGAGLVGSIWLRGVAFHADRRRRRSLEATQRELRAS